MHDHINLRCHSSKKNEVELTINLICRTISKIERNKENLQSPVLLLQNHFVRPSHYSWEWKHKHKQVSVINQLPTLTYPLEAFLLENLGLLEDLLGSVFCLTCGHLMTQNPANVSQDIEKHGCLKKHLSLSHVKAKPFDDQLGYLAVGGYDLQNYAGMLS